MLLDGLAAVAGQVSGFCGKVGHIPAVLAVIVFPNSTVEYWTPLGRVTVQE